MMAAAAMAAPPARAGSGVVPTTLTPDQALAALMDGNARFRAGQVPPGAADPARRAALAAGQAPFAAILSCADSRTPPELLFHAGLGELFVVRNAGNTADTAVIGSLEYAVGVLGTPLVMVVGHESCGAIAAAIELAEKDTRFPGSIGDMLLPLLPAAVAGARTGGEGKLDAAVAENARRTRDRLLRVSPVMAEAAAAGRLRVVSARYDLDQGRVTLVA
jgi:carbonic anhydrase